MSNSNIQTALPTGSFGGDEYLQEINRAIWDRWLGKGAWDYRDAIRLTACGPCNSILKCRENFENGIRDIDNFPDDIYACFYERANNPANQIHAILELYESEVWSQYGFPDNHIPIKFPPVKFIEWALSKKAIAVPQEMMDWYAVNRPQENEMPDAMTACKLKKRRDEVTQTRAAQQLKVSERTIRNWDNGIGTPDGYPGRAKVAPFFIFANGYESSKRLTNEARQQNRAVSAGDMSEYGEAYEDD